MHLIGTKDGSKRVILSNDVFFVDVNDVLLNFGSQTFKNLIFEPTKLRLLLLPNFKFKFTIHITTTTTTNDVTMFAFVILILFVVIAKQRLIDVCEDVVTDFVFTLAYLSGVHKT